MLSREMLDYMRETVLNVQLDHTCTIQRYTITGVDPNGANVGTWANFLVDEPCHYWESSEEELTGNENALLTRRRLVIQPNRGVKPGDRVTKLTGYDSTMIENEIEILHVLDRAAEAVLMLKEIS